jgi:GNAT superfamily N-acetyltransferase
MPSGSLPDQYSISQGYPPVEIYMNLRKVAGLSEKSKEQGEGVAKGSWFGVVVTHDATNEVVGMGRVIGDGAWYFHVVDMAVLPNHQRKGIGDAILGRLLQEIEDKAPNGAYVNLVADFAGRKLYARHGFIETAPKSVSMEKRYPIFMNSLFTPTRLTIFTKVSANT